jgi:hypothetical protein
VSAQPRTQRVSLVVVRLLVAGESRYLLTRTGRLDGWSLLTAPLGYDEGLDWHRAAVRGAERELAPLRFGEDFWLVALLDQPISWATKSISGIKTAHRAQVFGLRFAREMARLPSGGRLVSAAQLGDYRDPAINAVLAAVPDPPLSWGGAPAGTGPAPSPVTPAPTPPRSPSTTKVSVPPRAPRAPAVAPATREATEPGTIWTPDVIARLGVDTDTRISRELGVSISAVSQRRRALGIQRSPDATLEARQWTEAEDALLAMEPDGEVARQLGVTLAAVRRRRLVLGVPGCGADPSAEQEPADLAGAEYERSRRAGRSIADIARQHHVDRKTVERALLRYTRRVEARTVKRR